MEFIFGFVFRRVIIIKMGALETMKYLKSKMNLDWLLNTAVNRALSNECKQICIAALLELQDLNVV